MSNKTPPHVSPEAILTALIEMHMGLISTLVATKRLGLNELQLMAQMVPQTILSNDYDPRFKQQAAEFAKQTYAHLPWKEWEALASGKGGKPS